MGASAASAADNRTRLPHPPSSRFAATDLLDGASVALQPVSCPEYRTLIYLICGRVRARGVPCGVAQHSMTPILPYICGTIRLVPI